MGKQRWVAGLTIAGAGALLAGVLGTSAAASGSSYVNWAQYLYSGDHSSDNTAATAITTANATRLTQAWQFSPPRGPAAGLGGFYSSPTVYDGAIYIGAKNGYFYSVNEQTGAVNWKQFVGYVKGTTCGAEGFTSTATVAPDPATGKPTAYVFGANGYVYAFNTAQGSIVWKGYVDTPSTTKNNYYSWSSPLVWHGNVYIGISSQCDTPLVRAGLAEFNQATGAREGTFWTTPAGTRGASIWSSPATDGSSVFVTTGNGPKGSDGYSMIKLSPSLSEKGIWAVPKSQQAFDSDFGGSPGIWSATISGKPTEMVGACNKNGTFYAFNAADISAGPVWQDMVGNPYPQGPGQCDAAPVWNGSTLYVSSNGTKLGGSTYAGAVRAVNPATGAYLWQTGLTGAVIGTPSMDGDGVIAAPTFTSPSKQNGVFLIDAATGKILNTIHLGDSADFAQPVFADRYLFVASQGKGLQAFDVSGTSAEGR